jgi:hypothetical protein
VPGGLSSVLRRQAREHGLRLGAQAVEVYYHQFCDLWGASLALWDALSEHVGLVIEQKAAARTTEGANPGVGVDGSANVFQRDNGTWTIRFGTHTIQQKHTLGLFYIAELIAKKGRSIAAGTLRAAGHGQVPTKGGAGAEAADEEALRKYRDRLEEIDAELNQAERKNDVGTKARLDHDRAALLAEIRKSTGLGQRVRKLNEGIERHRKAVSNAIRRAISAIEKQHRELGVHLDTSIQTGRAFCYLPKDDVAWRV